MSEQKAILSQYFTPAWFAELLVERYFPALSRNDLVLEPCCGDGALLQAIPSHVPAIGCEIDSEMAERARVRTGRRVLTGDFRTISLDVQPTVVIGNPPFRLKLIEQFLDRIYTLLPEGGRAGFILPCYALQTASTITQLADRWSIAQEMIPRNMFPGLSKPLLFAIFSKEIKRTLVGFAFYHETESVLGMSAHTREILSHGSTRSSIWKEAVEEALKELGGEAALSDVYSAVSGRRPSRTRFWKEKVRQTLNRYFFRIGGARYSLSSLVVCVSAP